MSVTSNTFNQTGYSCLLSKLANFFQCRCRLETKRDYGLLIIHIGPEVFRIGTHEFFASSIPHGDILFCQQQRENVLSTIPLFSASGPYTCVCCSKYADLWLTICYIALFQNYMGDFLRYAILLYLCCGKSIHQHCCSLPTLFLIHKLLNNKCFIQTCGLLSKRFFYMNKFIKKIKKMNGYVRMVYAGGCIHRYGGSHRYVRVVCVAILTVMYGWCVAVFTVMYGWCV